MRPGIRTKISVNFSILRPLQEKVKASMRSFLYIGIMNNTFINSSDPDQDVPPWQNVFKNLEKYEKKTICWP